MTDIHSHILPFVDDGSDSYEKSIEMLKKHISQGVKNVVLTPHFRMGSFALGNDKIIEEFNNFKEKVKEELPSIDLYLGREITLYRDMISDVEKGNFLPINNGKFVLIEFPYVNEVDADEICYRVRLAGFIPIVAHVERYDYLRKANLVEQLRKNGAVIQINAHSVARKDRKEEAKFAKIILKKRLVDVVASDIHYNREDVLGEAYKKACKKYGEEYADLIFKINPERILCLDKK